MSLESPSTPKNRQRLNSSDAESPQNISSASKFAENQNSFASKSSSSQDIRIKTEDDGSLKRALSNVMADEKKRRESRLVEPEDFIESAIKAATEPFDLKELHGNIGTLNPQYSY